MTAEKAHPRVILITDPGYSLDHICAVIDQAASALPPGALMVQLRDKSSLYPVLRQHMQRLREVTRNAGARLTMNVIRPMSNLLVDFAEELELDGLHVPCAMASIVAARDVLPWVSTPVHSEADALLAWRARVDAMLVSPIFMTPGKGPPRGARALIHASSLGRSATYALGGVSPHHVSMCAQSGAHGVAVIRALLDADDPAEVARALAAPFSEV